MKTFYYSVVLSFILGYAHNGKAQYIFDATQIHQFEIFFYDADWDHKLDSLASLGVGTGSGSGRILADVVIDGIQYDSCGVRYKGNSSMDTTSNKNPFNIDLNYVIPGQEHQGKDKFKLANCYADPSMIREALSYELANQYMDCPLANFTKLYINGGYRGLYTNTESIDNEFLTEHYGSSSNTFVKCDPVSFELYGNNSNLAYHADTMAYDTLYDMKSIYGLTELQALTYELANNPNTIEDHLDVDRALWFLAYSSAVVHNDGYTAFAHNYYLYKQDNGRWSIILWDVNMAFGGLLWNGTNFFPLVTQDLQEQHPFIHAGTPDFRPLIYKLLNIPLYQKIYIAHYKTIVEENFTNNYYMQRAQWWHDLIDNEVPNEPYPFYSYQDFVDNLTVDYGTWFDLRPGIENLIEGRKAYLDTFSLFQLQQPDILNVDYPVDPDPFTTVTITAEVNNENTVWVGYRYHEFDVFTSVQMFDDGAHNDGAAGDNVYGVDIPVQALDVQFYVFAESATGARFYPARAQYEFLTITPKKGLVINELSAFNNNIWADQMGDYDDWIELYNNSDVAVDLGEYYLSDTQDTLFKWSLPALTLQPGEYTIFWADNEPGEGLDHANFKLSSNGETLVLSHYLDSMIDIVDFPDQWPDITWGRYPNGTGNFNFLLPTFGTENTTLAGGEKIEIQEMALYPNPTVDAVSLRLERPVNTVASLYDLSGRELRSIPFNGSQLKMDVSDLPTGTYIIRLKTGQIEKLIKL